MSFDLAVVAAAPGADEAAARELIERCYERRPHFEGDLDARIVAFTNNCERSTQTTRPMPKTHFCMELSLLAAGAALSDVDGNGVAVRDRLRIRSRWLRGRSRSLRARGSEALGAGQLTRSTRDKGSLECVSQRAGKSSLWSRAIESQPGVWPGAS